ncbi:Cu-Zn family superoxide dismutase [Paucimonas lemoignei]|uniref:Superoxide dismutase [Cu-Zn] n=1 Tax=Paucimonas lemoignei TaxID=29443 RepID=A0A4R3HZ93_PAULE|nr:superoxide dismutase family protein [Paucimonas lemoignei]TCS36829.1 Cu-Zn family superoxide dismutase [Paucimonas lemoignei]
MKITSALTASLIAVALAACASTPTGGASAQAELKPTQGNTARGTVTFTQQGDQVAVVAKFSGLTPGGHGFHIHEKGDCSAPDATSAGGHFNPAGKPHGHPKQGEHHAGDLPMLEADANGNASLTATLSGLGLTKGENGIVERGVIVHAAPDDFKTQPTGNSGGRVACGVIAAN